MNWTMANATRTAVRQHILLMQCMIADQHRLRST